MPGTEVFTADINRISRTEFDAAYFSMSEKRRKKCDGLRFRTDKDLCVAVDMLLRKVLGERLGIKPDDLVFDTDDKGKPYLVDGAYQFNVSHSGTVAAAAINKEKSVGVDVERIKPVSSAVAGRVFSDDDIKFVFEQDTIPAGKITDRETLVRFFKVWTYKEAFVKMTGEGITDNLKNFSYEEKRCFSYVFDDYVLTVITAAE